MIDLKAITESAADTDSTDVVFRPPELRDGAALWRLVRDSGTLDLNSPYAYLLWCDRFSGTSVVVEIDGRPAGFVCGFRPPATPDVLFVWQVAVADGQRGKRLAQNMLTELLRRGQGYRYLEASVTPSNSPSQALFRSLAQLLGCPCDEQPYIRAEDFPEGSHEPEILFRIGPFDVDHPHHPEEITR
jgi:L-2,4-diaminobutyric acid acetyltransferase